MHPARAALRQGRHLRAQPVDLTRGSEVAMKRRKMWWAAGVLVAAGCGTTAAYSTQQVADSQAEIRTAEAVGADREPVAALHLQLAREQFRVGKDMLAKGEKHRADFMLARASSDAALAQALTHQVAVKAQAQQALQQIRTMQTTLPQQ
jgi:hypothetical protein